MFDFSGRAARAGTRCISAVAAISCLAVMPQPAHAGVHGSAVRKHGHDISHRDHDRRNGQGGANLVVDTKGPQGVILPGRTYKWPYEVTNKGTLPARNVSLTATPDKGLKVLALPPKCRWQHGSRLFCKIGLLPQGETRHGDFTATVAPRQHAARPLINPVQVSWRSSPSRETRRTEFPPASRPGKEASRRAEPAAVPYPVMQTQRGPGAAEAVVVRSSVSPLAPVGPCALILPARVGGGKTTPVKPNAGTCEAAKNPAEPVPASASGEQCALDPTGHDVRGLLTAPCATPGRTAVTPCEAAAAKAAKTETGRPARTAEQAKADPAVPPCAAKHDEAVAAPCGVPAPATDAKPAAPSCATGDQAVAAPCGAVAKPVTDAKPAVPPCAAKRDEAVAAPCGAAVPAKDAKPAADAKPAIPPCAAGGLGSCECRGRQAAAPDVVVVPGMPVMVPDRPAHHATPAEDHSALTPCQAAEQDTRIRPAAPSCAPVKENPAASPCDAAAKPAADAAAPCAAVQGGPVLAPCRAAEQGAQVKEAVPPCASARNQPAVTPCKADEGTHVNAGACAGEKERPVVAPCRAAEHVADRPYAPCLAGRDRPAEPGAVAPRRPSSGVVVVPGTPGIVPLAPLAPLAPLVPVAPIGSGEQVTVPGHAVTLPCGAVAETPVAAQDVPVTSPCAGASGIPQACGCVAAQDRPAGTTPETPDAAPAAPPVPGGVSPCQALADKPMAEDAVVPGKSATLTCAGTREHPVDGESVPITPLASPGKSLHRPAGRHERPVMGREANDPVILPGRVPSRRGHFVRVPRSYGRAHKGCLAQGTGFICPLGSAPRGGHHVRPALHSRPGVRPERFQCGSGGAACHTRMARPLAARPNVTVRHLPTTGTSSALLALSGLGLAGAGAVLYRVGRSRRRQEG